MIFNPNITIFHKRRGTAITIRKLLEQIKDGEWRKEVEILRGKERDSEQEAHQNHVLTKFTLWLTSGGRKIEDKLMDSGLVAAVLKTTEIEGHEIVELRASLIRDHRLFAAWITPKSDGIQLLCRDRYNLLRITEECSKRWKVSVVLNIDSASEVACLCVSYDPDLYVNESAEQSLSVDTGLAPINKLLPDSSSPLPFAPEMEKAMVSLAMMEPAVIARSGLTAADFYDDTHRELWTLIASMSFDGEAIDLMTIIGKLRTLNRLSTVGGEANLASIYTCCPVASHHEEYANVVREKACRRHALAISANLAREALNEVMPLGSTLARCKSRFDELLPRLSSSASLDELDARRINPESPPPRPEPVITLQGQQISTAGNLTVLSAQVKSGKSAAVGAILAALLAADSGNESADTFSFAGRATGGKAVIHFDTEQSPHDAYLLVARACRRAGVGTTPSNYRAYSLCDIATAKRRQFLAAEMARAEAECGGIHAVTIDGIADLICDPNAADEAFGLVEEIFQLAVRHNCPIVSVLHENPSVAGGVGKTRGHLGSQLERKAESNLRLVKKGEVSTIFSDKCRSASLPESQGAKFAWCDQAEMHVSIEADTADRKREKEREGQLVPCQEVFASAIGHLSFTELRKGIERVTGVKSTASEKRISKWLEIGLIKKTDGKGYIRQ